MTLFDLDALEPPRSAAVGLARQFWAMKGPVSGTKLQFSVVEAPSAIVATRMALRERGDGGPVPVRFDEIPKPDPRDLSNPVAFRIWTYHDTENGTLCDEARPGMEPPSEPVRRKLADLAATPAPLSDWMPAALEAAASVTDDEARELVAALAYPLVRHEATPPWTWVFRSQVACALLVMAGGASAEFKSTAYHAVFGGPVDWAGAAMISAMTAIARHTPSEAPTMLSGLLPLLQTPTSDVECACVFEPLISCIPLVPGVDPSLVRTLGAVTDVLVQQQAASAQGHFHQTTEAVARLLGYPRRLSVPADATKPLRANAPKERGR